jgi:L-fuconolactonase
MNHSIIDTHVHVWDLESARYAWLEGSTSILNRTYRLEEIQVERVSAGVTGGVLVQAENHLEDTEHMLRVARASGWITGVVGWLPLMDPAETARLLTDIYLHEPLFKGVRHLIHGEPDPKWLLQPEVLESLSILAAHDIPFDVVGVLPEHIETAMVVADRVPSLRMVFDHLNQPPIASGVRYGRWGELMKVAAQHFGFHMKISGLGIAGGDFAGRKSEDILPYVSFTVEHFGAERCFCGGDWPVSLLAMGYADTWALNRRLVEEVVGSEEVQAVLATNAIDFYKL